MTTLSVLICTYNRPALLRKCLAALIQGAAETPDLIVVVVGVGPEGQGAYSESVARSFNGNGVELAVVCTPNKNLAANRNVGIPLCQTDIVAMTDDDAEVFPDWVTRMKWAHAECPEAGAVGGLVVGADSESLIGRLADQVTFRAYLTKCTVRTLPGVNVSYKRRVTEQLGPQDESFDLNCGEDVDYNWRLQQLGYTVWFDPAIQVLHHHRPTLRGWLRQHYMYGRAYYLVRRKWPEMYCVYPHRLRRPIDWLKLVNFVVAPFYEPIKASRHLRRTADLPFALPLLWLNQVAWRWGMVRQRLAG